MEKTVLLPGDETPEGPDPRLGTLIDRKYSIVRVLGRGGMGAVYEARHATLARRFAIKFLLPEFSAHREVLRRFENEAKAAGGLEHPNLAAVTDIGRGPDGSPYLVMEYLQGEDCSKLLRRVGPLPVLRAVNIVTQACRGLAVAHKAGIVHRDLKPENLFVTDAGDGTDLVKVLDFGIAKLKPTDTSLATSTGAAFGTAHYMSPEQARGAADIDHRTDVWSMGVVLYELLCGKKPFDGDQFLNVIYEILHSEPNPLARHRANLPTRVLETVDRALTKDAGSRLPSITAMTEALKPFAGAPAAESVDRPVEATLPTPPTRLPSTEAPAGETGDPTLDDVPMSGLRTRRLVVAAAVAAALLFVIVVAAKTLSRSSETALGAQSSGSGVPAPPRAEKAPEPAPHPAPPTPPPLKLEFPPRTPAGRESEPSGQRPDSTEKEKILERSRRRGKVATPTAASKTATNAVVGEQGKTPVEPKPEPAPPAQPLPEKTEPLVF